MMLHSLHLKEYQQTRCGDLSVGPKYLARNGDLKKKRKNSDFKELLLKCLMTLKAYQNNATLLCRFESDL